jgi:hypothetical protein
MPTAQVPLVIDRTDLARGGAQSVTFTGPGL